MKRRSRPEAASEDVGKASTHLYTKLVGLQGSLYGDCGMSGLEALRNVLARVVAARCELESGDTLTGDMILADLECDLVGIAERHDEPRAFWVLELEGRAATQYARAWAQRLGHRRVELQDEEQAA